MSILMLSKTLLSLAKQLSLRGKWISWISMFQEESRTGLFLTHKLWTRTLFQSYFQVLSGLHFHLSSRIHWTNCFELSIIEPIPVGNTGRGGGGLGSTRECTCEGSGSRWFVCLWAQRFVGVGCWCVNFVLGHMNLALSLIFLHMSVSLL